MECYKIRELLSEYIDGALDPEHTKGIRDHLTHCEKCSQEFAALKAVVDSMNSLELVKAPEDFLESVHARIHQRSRFKRALYALFVPAQIKIPLDLAGVLATAVLVALLLGIPQRYVEKRHGKEKLALHLAEERDLGVYSQPEQKIHTEKPPQPPVPSESLSRKSPPQSLRAKKEPVACIDEKEGLIEVAIVLKHDLSEMREPRRPFTAFDKEKDYYGVALPSAEQEQGKVASLKKQNRLEKGKDYCVEAPPSGEHEQSEAASPKKQSTLEEDKAFSGLQETPGEEKSFSDLLKNDVSRIRRSLESLQGKYISTEYDPLTRQPYAILVEIPAEKYGAFLGELAHIGDLERPLQSEPTALTRHIRVRIMLIQPH